MGENSPGGRIRDVPDEQKGNHPEFRQQPRPIVLSNEEIERDFIAAFTPQHVAPVGSPKPPVYEPEIHIEPKEPDPNLKSLILPPNTILFDAEGEKVMISEALRVEGHWVRPPKGKKGPAKFEITTLYPSGIQKKGVQAHGEFALRIGPLWSGQKPENKNK